ncbi:MAG: toxin C-terminal domain-containing protein [Polyangiaceae bacterium]
MNHPQRNWIWLRHLSLVTSLLVACLVPRPAKGSADLLLLPYFGGVARSYDALHLPHARAIREANEHAFAGEVAPPQANSSARVVVSRSHASPRMARVGAGKYEYDAFGRRIKKTKYDPQRTAPVTTLYTWDGEVLAAEIDTEEGPRNFVHAPGTFEPMLQQQNGEVFLCVNDHLGMPKDLVAGDGAVAWSATHSAYGRVVATYADDAARSRYGTAINSPFRLLGQVADDDAELCFTRYRCFDPEIGSWISSDPLEVAGGLNLYGFDGAPTDVVDPLGLATGGGNPHGPVYKTDKEAEAAASKLGFKKIKEKSHGQAVFSDGKRFISRDVDGHNGGAWKMAKSARALGSKSTRSGTYDANLNRIGD